MSDDVMVKAGYVHLAGIGRGGLQGCPICGGLLINEEATFNVVTGEHEEPRYFEEGDEVSVYQASPTARVMTVGNDPDLRYCSAMLGLPNL